MINQRIFSANVGDSSVGIAGPDAIEQDIDNLLANDQELEEQIAEHLADSMPHQFVDGIKTYRWGFRTLNGQPQFIYEEVVE